MDRKQSAAKGAEQHPLRIVVEKNIVGEFTHEIGKRFKAAVADAKGAVTLDLAAVTIVDSHGVALCVGLFRECQRKNLPFSIVASPELYRFFKLLKLDRVLQFTEKGSAT